jgi:glycosyltransferase involved in cell wall biosynthesis
MAVAFPGPTAARKGAYELRAAARKLNFEVVLLGAELEGGNSWEGVPLQRRARGSADWLEGVAVVVQPSLVEENPRALLAAINAGVPVIATAACGLGQCPGVVLVTSGREDELASAINAVRQSAPRLP